MISKPNSAQAGWALFHYEPICIDSILPSDCDCNSTLGCTRCRVLLSMDSESNYKTKVVTSGDLVSEDEVVKPISTEIPVIVLAPAQ